MYPPSLRHPSLCLHLSLHLMFRPACIFMSVVNMEKGKTLVKYSNAQICSASSFIYDDVRERRGSLRTRADLTLYICFCDSISWFFLFKCVTNRTGPERLCSRLHVKVILRQSFCIQNLEAACWRPSVLENRVCRPSKCFSTVSEIISDCMNMHHMTSNVHQACAQKWEADCL